MVYCLPFALVFIFVGRRAFLGDIRGGLGEGLERGQVVRKCPI